MEEARADARNQMRGREVAAVARLEDRGRNMADEDALNRLQDLDTYNVNNRGVTGYIASNNPPVFGGRRRTNRRRTNKRKNKRSNRKSRR